MARQSLRDRWDELVDNLDDNKEENMAKVLKGAAWVLIGMVTSLVFISQMPFPYWADLILLGGLIAAFMLYRDKRRVRLAQMNMLASAPTQLVPSPARPVQAAEYEGENPTDLDHVVEADEQGEDEPVEAYIPENQALIRLPNSLSSALADDERIAVYSRPFPVVTFPRLAVVALALLSVATSHFTDMSNNASYAILVMVVVAVSGLVLMPVFRLISRYRAWKKDDSESDRPKRGRYLLTAAFSLLLAAAFFFWLHTNGWLPLGVIQSVGTSVWTALVWTFTSWKNFTIAMFILSVVLLLIKTYYWLANPYAITNRHFWRSFGVIHTEWRKVKLESINDDGFKAPLEKLRLNLPFGTLNIETAGHDDEDFKNIVGFRRKHLKWLTRSE